MLLFLNLICSYCPRPLQQGHVANAGGHHSHMHIQWPFSDQAEISLENTQLSREFCTDTGIFPARVLDWDKYFPGGEAFYWWQIHSTFFSRILYFIYIYTHIYIILITFYVILQVPQIMKMISSLRLKEITTEPEFWYCPQITSLATVFQQGLDQSSVCVSGTFHQQITVARDNYIWEEL